MRPAHCATRLRAGVSRTGAIAGATAIRKRAAPSCDPARRDSPAAAAPSARCAAAAARARAGLSDRQPSDDRREAERRQPHGAARRSRASAAEPCGHDAVGCRPLHQPREDPEAALRRAVRVEQAGVQRPRVAAHRGGRDRVLPLEQDEAAQPQRAPLGDRAPTAPPRSGPPGRARDDAERARVAAGRPAELGDPQPRAVAASGSSPRALLGQRPSRPCTSREYGWIASVSNSPFAPGSVHAARGRSGTARPASSSAGRRRPPRRAGRRRGSRRARAQQRDVLLRVHAAAPEVRDVRLVPDLPRADRARTARDGCARQNEPVGP